MDCGNHRILKFDCSFYLILKQQHDVKLDYPFGICIVDKNVYVADRESHRVQVQRVCFSRVCCRFFIIQLELHLTTKKKYFMLLMKETIQ